MISLQIAIAEPGTELLYFTFRLRVFLCWRCDEKLPVHPKRRYWRGRKHALDILEGLERRHVGKPHRGLRLTASLSAAGRDRGAFQHGLRIGAAGETRYPRWLCDVGSRGLRCLRIRRAARSLADEAISTATSITANSRQHGLLTYSLQKRNHPKTGDAMIVLDGDAFVTSQQRPPW